MMKQVIYFDIGDTLYFSEEMEKQYPQKLYELISQREGLTLAEAKESLKTASDSLEGKIPHVTKVAAMASLGYTRSEVHEAFCSVKPNEFLKPDLGLNDFMKELSRAYPLGIISNFKKNHALDIFTALQLDPGVFTYFVTEDIVSNIKPDLEPFQKAVELSGVSSSQCWYVADSISKDLKPAKQVGMRTVWVNTKPLKEDQKRWVDAQVNGVMEIKKLFIQ